MIQILEEGAPSEAAERVRSFTASIREALDSLVSDPSVNHGARA
jgi:hypothetical protein